MYIIPMTKSNENLTYDCHYHVVFCPKYRRPILVGEIADRLSEIIRLVFAELGVVVEAMEVMPDHVHLLLSVDPQFGIHRAVKRVKGRSSRLLRSEFRSLKSRLPTLWTNSYFVSTTGGAPLEQVRAYVENQKGR